MVVALALNYRFFMADFDEVRDWRKYCMDRRTAWIDQWGSGSALPDKCYVVMTGFSSHFLCTTSNS